MRPAQQNRRMRGRGNNNNRKGPNPLTRNYESNGPDVKIRGNAQHIAEKYATLARDAQVSGDRVMAENYLQHAEHYNRIILQAQAQNPQHFQRDESFDDEGADDEEQGFAAASSHNGHNNAPSQDVSGSGPQPFIEGTPAEVVYDEDNSAPTRSHEQRAQSRDQNRDNQNRDHQNRDNNNGRDREQRRIQRPRRPSRFEQHGAPVAPDAPQPITHFTENSGQPEVNEQPVVKAVEIAQEQPVAVKAEPVVASVAAVVEAEEKPVKKAAPAKPRTPRAKPAEAAAEVDGEQPVRRRPGRPRRVKEDDAEPVKEASEA
ncbi:DUF4167 domain-containing protein [Paenochrobactrum pullorum]|uniref:DUF4167 domain-containing protein n=1 Tax=Paenochrobactrum pullorum TaxID=1324351 RepID=UPI0035BBB687